MGYLSSIFLRFFLRQVLLSKERLSPKFRGNRNKSKKSLFLLVPPTRQALGGQTDPPPKKSGRAESGKPLIVSPPLLAGITMGLDVAGPALVA